MAFVSLMTVGFLSVILGVTAQVSSAEPAPITDYGAYPGPLPATCAVDGANVITGASYSVNGTTASDLNDLAPNPGDTVTMTWTGFAPGCETVGIGLSVKIALAPTFNAEDDQYLHAFDYCGPLGPACEAPYTLSIAVMPASTAPCWQIDAHLGAPLSIVGPSGSYYGLGRTPNMLISANNGGANPCAPPPCETNPAVPAGAIECTPVTSTTLSPPTTVAPTTTAPPAVVPTSAAVTPTTVCAETEVLDASTGRCIEQSSVTVLGIRQTATTVAAVRATIPVTGASNNGNLLLASFGLVMMGGALSVFARRPATTS